MEGDLGVVWRAPQVMEEQVILGRVIVIHVHTVAVVAICPHCWPHIRVSATIGNRSFAAILAVGIGSECQATLNQHRPWQWVLLPQPPKPSVQNPM